MQKRDKAYQRGQVDQFKRLRNKIFIENRKEKTDYYDKKITPKSSHNPMSSWKLIKKMDRIVAMKQHTISITDPETQSGKESADYINIFFCYLNKNNIYI